MQTFSKTAISKIVKRLDSNKREIERLSADNDELKKKVEAYYYATAKDEILVDDDFDKKIKAKVVNQTRVTFFVEKMEEKFSKKMLKVLCDKEYLVNEEELQELLREMPELKQFLRRFITVKYNPNSDRISDALRRGIITNKDLKGCYSAKESLQVRISRVSK